MDEKDRLGEILHEKERAEENRYFTQRDQELIAILKEQQEAEHEENLREMAKTRFPRCGVRLTTKTIHDAEIDECPECQGIWFDKGELEAMSQQKGSVWVKQFLDGIGRIFTGSSN